MKFLAGDDAPEVLGACLEGLLAIDARRYLPLAERALDDDHVGEHAALALGESRLEAALPVLRRALEATADDKRAGLLLLCVALLRHEAALELVFDVLERGPERMAAHAVHALAVHRHTASVADRVHAVASRRNSRSIATAVADAFGR